MPKKSTTSARKKNAWFYSVRGSYLPRSWQAWALYIPYAAILLGSVAWAHQNDASVADQVFKVFPVWVATAVVMTWIAKTKS